MIFHIQQQEGKLHLPQRETQVFFSPESLGGFGLCRAKQKDTFLGFIKATFTQGPFCLWLYWVPVALSSWTVPMTDKHNLQGDRAGSNLVSPLAVEFQIGVCRLKSNPQWVIETFKSLRRFEIAGLWTNCITVTYILFLKVAFRCETNWSSARPGGRVFSLPTRLMPGWVLSLGSLSLPK